MNDAPREARAAANSACPEPPPYRRTPLLSDATHEILLMAWRPDAICAAHDHGAAGGVIHVVRGAVVERRYAFDGRGLVATGERRADAPALLEVEPGVIHDMRAVGEALTLHVYTPRVAGMRVFDPISRETLVVRDDCGAWLPDQVAPAEPGMILAREAWDAAVERGS